MSLCPAVSSRRPSVDVLPLLVLCAIALILAIAGIWLVASP